MPSLDAFAGVSQGWINQIAAVASGAVKETIEEGAQAMRDGINDSSTGTPWHLKKNQQNDFEDGARIGNRNPMVGEVDPHSGQMLASVSSAGPVKTNGGKHIEGFFGWIDAKEPYFLLQDVGNYGVGEQVGMGLLNNAMNNDSITQMSAYVAAKEKLISSLSAAGLKSSGGAR